MDAEPSSPPPPRPRMFRCYCRRRRETDPLFRAVLANDLKELKSLVEAGNSVNILNSKGSSLLNFVIRRKRVEIFDYLLSLDETNVNFLDRLEQTPLIYTAGVCFDEYFAQELIKKGADVNLTDESGFTFLHLAAKSESEDTLSTGQLVIEKGADVNQQEDYGVTPLYAACESGKLDWVCMLLYYGADPTIVTERGVLPLAVISQDIPEEQQLQLQEILFSYTFDGDKTSIKLPTLVAAMTSNSMLFSKILDNISEIDYDIFDLQYLVTSLLLVKPKHLKLFMEKYGYIVLEMIKNFSPMDVLMSASEYGVEGLKEIFDIFLNSDYAVEFVQSSVPANPKISHLLEIVVEHPDPSFDREEITKMICLMLTYGLTVTSTDLDAVYDHFGYCELFRILLHMDIIITNRSYTNTQSIAGLYYDPFSKIDNFFDDASLCSILLDYYNNHKLKESVAASSDENESLEKVKGMPQVPLLLELSRNAARKYIIDSFNIKKSAQFYTILRWLPIGEMNKNIIALDKKLY